MGWIHPDDQTEAAALAAVHHLEALLMWARRLGRQALSRRWEGALVKLGAAVAHADARAVVVPRDAAGRKRGRAAGLVRVRHGGVVCVARHVPTEARVVDLSGASGNPWVDAALERLLRPHRAIVPVGVWGEFVHHVRTLIECDPTMRRLVSRLRIVT